RSGPRSTARVTLDEPLRRAQQALQLLFGTLTDPPLGLTGSVPLAAAPADLQAIQFFPCALAQPPLRLTERHAVLVAVRVAATAPALAQPGQVQLPARRKPRRGAFEEILRFATVIEP